MLRLLPFLIPAAAGTITTILAYLLLTKSGERKWDTLKIFSSFFSDILLVALLLWKISPLFFNFSWFAAHPMSLLFAPGGRAGFIIAAAGSFLLIAYRLSGKGKWQIPRDLRVSILILTLVWIAGASGSLLVWNAYSRQNSASARESESVAAGSLEDKNRELLFRSHATSGGGEASIADPDKVTAVNFWASWCAPCLAEIPELIAFQQQLENGKISGEVRFITINLTASEKEPGDARRFIEDNELPFLVIEDPDGELSSFFSIKSIPATVIISPEGDIIYRHEGVITASQLRSTLLWRNR
jgi:thiol-disulfide isomerase/thioredoxin